MKKVLIIIVILFSATQLSYSVEGYWKKIQNIPQIVKYNHWLDIFFLPSNPNYGWICGMEGRVLLTTDGGNNWTLSNQQLKTGHLERVMFMDQNVGFCSGTLDQASPPGVYRTSNGGKTWTDITPLELVDLYSKYFESGWSCYFIDKNNGVYCAGDCGTDSIYFFRTTNGGTDWTVDRKFCPDNRLCDAVLYSTSGEGYALSGSVFWQTNDGGFTWDTLSVTGKPSHQEEISKVGNMVLIPYSGSSCDGGSNRVGGYKLSRDGGKTWKAFDTGNNMFGTFMINSSEAWAVGDNAAVYYTSDGGVNWEIKNCGIDGNDLDDVFFLNPTKGWTAGKDGIFALTPIEQKLDKTNIVFPATCVNEEAYDTIWVTNKSFDNVSVKRTLTSTDQPDISIISPTQTTFTVQNCDSVPVIVAYKPQLKAKQVETWSFEFQSGPKSFYNVMLTGDPAYSTAKTVGKQIIDTVYCNTKKTRTLNWTVESNFEYIFQYVKTQGSSWLNFNTPLPFPLKRGEPNTTEFVLNPLDTGWVDAKFEITTNPCNNENIVDVKCYGVSSIITAPKFVNINAKCFGDCLDTIPVKNTGNFDLYINNSYFVSGQSLLSVVGWLGETGATTTINPKKEKYLIIKYANGNDGKFTGTLRFINNDSTKTQGNKNPYDILINANRSKTNLAFQNEVLDFGTICYKQTYTLPAVIKNIGLLSAEVHHPDVNPIIYNLTSDLNRFPYTVKGDSTGKIQVDFTPHSRGNYLDTIFFKVDPCGETLKLIIKANVLKPELEFVPSKIEGITQAGFDLVTKLRIKNIGDINLNIKKMYIDPAIAGVNLTYTPNLPITLNTGTGNGTEAEFTLTLNSKTFMEIKNCLRIEAEGQCQLDTCVEMDVLVIDRLIRSLRDTVDFGFIKCDYNKFNEKLKLFNAAMQTDTIFRMDIIQSGNEFSFIQKPIQTVKAQDTLTLDVQFAPSSEGKFTAIIEIETNQPNGQVLRIPIKAEFRKTITTPLISNFDESITDTCIGIKKYTIRYKNAGTLTDTLNIIQKDNSMPVWTEPADKLIVEGLDSNDFNVFIDYGKFGSLGPKNVSVGLVSVVCPQNFEVNIKSDLKAPRVQSDKDTINFNAWMSYNDEKIVKLKNIYDKKLQITEVKIISGNPDYQYSLNLPIVLDKDEETSFSLKYNGNREGRFIDTLMVVAKDNCTEITPIILIATTPDEVYNFNLAMDKREVKMGDTVNIYLRLKNPVDLLVTDTIDYKFTFNSALIYPNQVWYKNANDVFVETDFSNRIGEISGEITGIDANNIFKKADKLMRINYTVLRYIPDTTTIFIDEFTPRPRKDIIWNKSNGFIKAKDYCTQEVSFGLKLMPQYEVNIKDIISENLEVELKSDIKDINVNMSLISLSGIKIFSTDLIATTKGNNTTLDITNVASGVYYCIFKSEFGQIIGKKVVFVK